MLDLENTHTFVASSADEMQAWGKQFGASLPPGAIVALFGDLGAGKTTLVQGIAEGIGVDRAAIASPTFTLLHIYEGRMPLYHFDLYRLPSDTEFLLAGFEEYLHYGDGISCIEWPDKIEHLLPPTTWMIRLSHLSDHHRSLTVSHA